LLELARYLCSFNPRFKNKIYRTKNKIYL